MAVHIDRSKPVEFSVHVRDKMLDRGANEGEVLMAIRTGSLEPARKGRVMFRKNFDFHREWRGGEQMKVSYDPAVDALTIRLIEQRVECETLHLNDQVAVDIGPDERLVAIEILDASELIPDIKEKGIAVENLAVALGDSWTGCRPERILSNQNSATGI